MKMYPYLVVLFMLQAGFAFCQPTSYKSSEFSQVENHSEKIRAGFGFGIGVPYGIIGINAEVFPIAGLSVSGGLGTTFFDGLGYSIGLRYYFRNPTKVWQPKLGINYGVNGLILIENRSSPLQFDGYKYNGISFEAGQAIMFGSRKRNGLDIGMSIIATSKVFEQASYFGFESPGRIRLILGYRFVF